VDFLQGNNLRLDFGEEYNDVTFITFLPLIDTVPIKIRTHEMLRLSEQTDAYLEIYVIWNPVSKKIAIYDVEHDDLYDISPFDEFLKNSGRYLQNLLDGDLEVLMERNETEGR